jgi:hypothetical protein
MIVTDNQDTADESGLLEQMNLPYPVRLSPELSELLKPNSFLAGLGIRYLERFKTVLNILKGNLIPKNGSAGETVPDKGIVFPIALTKGPYIREELISIRAELTDGDGKAEILLTAVPAQE